jgi:hypothetical protein
MATVEEIEAAVGALSATLRQRCPHLAPAIFLNGRTPKSIDELCTTNAQKNQVRSWLTRQTETSISFVTEILYNERKVRISDIVPASAVDAKLRSLEDVLQMLVLGNEDELMVSMSHFFEVNEYGSSIPEVRHIFNEVYDLAYSIKALIRWNDSRRDSYSSTVYLPSKTFSHKPFLNLKPRSATPDMKVTFGKDDIPVPFPEDVDVGALLESFQKKQGLVEDDSDEENDVDRNEPSGNKKRKRKRGKGQH